MVLNGLLLLFTIRNTRVDFFLHFIHINFWTLNNKYTALVKIANKCYDYYKTATQRLQINAIKQVTWDSFGSKNCSFLSITTFYKAKKEKGMTEQKEWKLFCTKSHFSAYLSCSPDIVTMYLSYLYTAWNRDSSPPNLFFALALVYRTCCVCS